MSPVRPLPVSLLNKFPGEGSAEGITWRDDGLDGVLWSNEYVRIGPFELHVVAVRLTDAPDELQAGDGEDAAGFAEDVLKLMDGSRAQTCELPGQRGRWAIVCIPVED